MMMKATLVKKLTGFKGDARLYRMDPPLTDLTWDGEGEVTVERPLVIVSAVVVFGDPETYIFPSNEDGEIISWGEMNGSQKHTLSHESVLSELGYEIT